MRVPAWALRTAAALVVLVALATAVIVAWRGAPGAPPPPAHRIARAHVKVLAKPPRKAPPPPISAYAREQSMTPKELVRRWDPVIAEASQRFNVPQPWIRAVIVAESGGRTMSSETEPITSRAGALGVMQLMPE